MLRYEFFKQLSNEQQEQRERLTARLPLPIGIITVLAGLLGSIVREFHHKEIHMTFVFIVLIILCCLLLGRSVFFLVKSYHGYQYAVLGLPCQLAEFMDELVSYVQTEDGKDQDAELLFKESVAKQYAEAANWNAVCNGKKSLCLHKANESLVWLIVPSVLVWIVFLLNLRII